MKDDLSDLFNEWVFLPQKNQIKIDFDVKGHSFSLSMPVFTSRIGLPESVERYVEARKDYTFRPHKTSLLNEDPKIVLLQKIPFVAESSLRREADDFLKMARHFHRLLKEIATEEKFDDVLQLQLDVELAE